MRFRVGFEPQKLPEDSLIKIEPSERLDEWDQLLRYDQAVQMGDVLFRNNITVGDLFEKLQESKYSKAYLYDYDENKLVSTDKRSNIQSIEIGLCTVYSILESEQKLLGAYTGFGDSYDPEAYFFDYSHLVTVYYIPGSSESGFVN